MKKLMLLCMALILLACTSKGGEGAMPLSMDNLNAYAEKIVKLSQSMEPKPDNTPIDLSIGIYKKAMDKMGYSFDETYRYLLVFNQMNGVTPASQLLGDVHVAIIKNRDEALQKGLISQRTMDFMKLRETGSILDESEVLGLTMVSECEGMSQDGYCNVENLISVFRRTLEARGGLGDPAQAAMDDIVFAQGRRVGNYPALESIPGGCPIIDSDGQRFKLSWVGFDSSARFKVDRTRIAELDNYSKRLREEQDYFKK